MIDTISKKLAPSGVLRVGLNMSNFLLVNGKDISGQPSGVSPDIGKKLAKELNLKCKLVQFQKPGLLADEVNNDQWDIGNIASEKKRAKLIDFTNPYVNIDANFMVTDDHELKTNKDFDLSAMKIGVVDRSAYDLWLTENFQNAKIIRVDTFENSYQLFRNKKVNILAGLKPKLLEIIKNEKKFKIMSNPFTFIKQSIGIKKNNPEILEFLNKFILTLIKEGYIENLLKKHNVQDKLSIPKTN